MRILVNGTSSFVGRTVADALARAGHEIFTSNLAPADADAIVWFDDHHDSEGDAPDVIAALDAIAETGKTFVYTSGVWVHGDTAGAVADESSHLHPLPIAAWRVDLEKAVLETPGIRAIVVRPGIAYGHGEGLPRTLIEWARRDGVMRMPGDGENHWPVVHVDDLAELYVRAIARAPSGTVLLGVHRTERFHDIAVAASQAAGRGGAVTPWPLPEAREHLGELADAFAVDQLVSSAKALRLLGWRPVGIDLLTDLTAGSYSPR